MHSYNDGEILSDAISRIDNEGYNAINFNEFVFLPIENNYMTNCDGAQPLIYYYFFEPYAPRLMRAWKKSTGLSMVDGAGHLLSGSEVRLAHENFALRHYIFTDQQHAYRKYLDRHFSEIDIAKGWHSNRIGQQKESFCFPSSHKLHQLKNKNSILLNTLHPKTKHYWQW